MTEALAVLATLSALSAAEVFERCCGSRRWAKRMAARRPFASQDELFAAADEEAAALDKDDWLEAFAAHPRIGNAADLAKRFPTRELAAGEQSGVAGATDATLAELAAGNRAYEERFGYIFIICATGKSAAEMLAALTARLNNDPDDELVAAAAEQHRITRLRLGKLLANPETIEDRE